MDADLRGTEQERRGLPTGILFWLGFGVIAVLLRGVRWEETYERAQVLAGMVVYPAGHPFLRYAQDAYTTQYYLSTAILRLIPGPLGVCAFRNVLFLWATTVPVFLMTFLVSRKALFAHVAVVLILVGVLQPLATYYPLFVWPTRFSSGHIGMACALLVLCLLTLGRLRLGFFLLGLLPCIHVGQAPVLFATAGLMVALEGWRKDERERLAKPCLWGGLGLLISLGIWIAIRAWSLPPPLAGPYFSIEDAMGLWREYISGEDVHRSLARFGSLENSILAVFTAAVLGILATKDSKRDDLSRIFLVYGLVAAAVAFVGIGGERILGSSTPFWLIGWMPQRMLNHVVVILMVISLGMLGRCAKPAAGYGALAVVLALLVLRHLFTAILPGDVLQRYLSATEVVAFGAAGCAAAATVLKFELRSRFWVPVIAVGLAPLAWFHQFGAGGFVSGFALVWALSKMGTDAGPCTRRRKKLAIVLCGTLLGLLMLEQWRTREHLPVTGFQRQVKAYLEKQGEPGAMLLTPHWWIGYQEATDHPVMYTYETPQFMSYMPSLSPSIFKMRRDLYGFQQGVSWDYSLDAWKSRSPEEWIALGREYSFRYVVSPNWLKLPFPCCVSDETQTLYRIEGDG